MRIARTHWTVAMAAAAVLSGTVGISPSMAAQAYGRGSLAVGTNVPIRTSEAVDVNSADGRVFTGVVDQDVMDANGRLAIPRGSTAELIVRKESNNNLSLDLDSLTINGERYSILADSNPVGTSGGVKSGAGTIGANKTTGEYIGGGALLGAIIGAVAGGGKGAAIGTAVGAAAGAGTQIVTQGKKVNVPAESLLTFKLQRGLTVGAADTGYMRNGTHFHRAN
jgi:hypothetical protein